ncbi:MAG: glutaminyl-peptide cyclotransferase [Caldilineaceae bacterium]|nr:glutaminyl-peptide cyclotransferase [Caldilineaceae bacterium]
MVTATPQHQAPRLWFPYIQSVQPTPTVSLLPTATPTPIPVYGYRVIERYPHDPNAFTQGLIYEDGKLYEGTGRQGQSTLRRVNLESGAVEQMVRLPDEFFGEGITLFGDRIIQLTWTSRVGFVFDRESFDLLSAFTYNTEGWGLTHDEEFLIMSDGSNMLTYLDPESFVPLRQVAVYAGSNVVNRLNELEYINGFIYANIWQTDRIAKIDPESGQVVAWIDLTGILPPEERYGHEDVLNGIAYDAEGDRLFVTGKLWPTLFWIELALPEQP